jgi:hypothetical protein
VESYELNEINEKRVFQGGLIRLIRFFRKARRLKIMRAFDKMKEFMAAQSADEPQEFDVGLEPKVLEQCPRTSQWTQAWRELADLTSGIEQSDSRLKPLINVLEQADKAFESDNWEEFQIAASRVENIANKGS